MQWPTMSDYQDAMQNPGLSFADPELRSGIPVTDRLGLPRPITGGFASVYQVVSNGRKWAVRCFLRHHQDSEQRYAVIGRTLSSSRLPYTVAFQYLRDGIRVKNKWYPILKMEWVDGEPLHTYVAKHRSKPGALKELAEAFSHMCRELRSRSIAHGDLQHGNILVVDGKLKLVDYDGMYVPGLDGLPSHEVGHPNYQHPNRSEDHFGPYLDSFSEWVIYVSLTALSVRPDLWDQLNVGDEQLLFSQRDFMNPAGSRALRIMRESGDPLLERLSQEFRQVIMFDDISSVPSPQAALDPSGLKHPVWRPAQLGGLLNGIARKIRAPQDRNAALPQEKAGPQVGVAASSTGSLPSWVQGHLQPEAVRLSPPFSVDRAVVGGYAAVVFALYRFHVAGYLSLQVALWCGAGGCIGTVAALIWRFLTRPEFRQKKALMDELKAQRREARRVEKAIKKLEKEKEAVLERERKSVENILHRLSLLASEEREETERLESWLQGQLKNVVQLREALNREEAEELAKAANSIQLPFLGKRASSIMKRYRQKREPLLRKEEKIRLEAEKRKDAIRRKYSSQEQIFHTKLAEVKMNYGKDAGDLDKKIRDENARLMSYRETESNLSRELRLYAEVSFRTYLRRIAFIR
jgi:serine/threonine protein kinase